MLLGAYEKFNISWRDPSLTFTGGSDSRKILVGLFICDIPWEAGRYNLYFMFLPLRNENIELGNLEF